jgi:serine/threonine-protein kinase
VEIYVTDDTGKHTAYSAKAAPGTTVSKDVSGTGNVHVQVIIDGSVVQDREL